MKVWNDARLMDYKISQTSNILTEKSQSGHSLRDGGSTTENIGRSGRIHFFRCEHGFFRSG
jgi:hypothetical protein